MKCALLMSALMAAFVFSCDSKSRVAPREVSRTNSESTERNELVGHLESAVSESNRLRAQCAELESEVDRLRAELESSRKPIDEQNPTLASEPEGYTPRLIVFTAVGWCAPCRVLDAEIKRLGSMTYVGPDGSRHSWREMIGSGPDHAIQIVDLSNEEDAASAEMAMRYLAGAVPTIVRIAADGSQESRFNGVMSAETLCLYQSGKWKPPKIPVNEKKVASRD